MPKPSSVLAQSNRECGTTKAHLKPSKSTGRGNGTSTGLNWERSAFASDNQLSPMIMMGKPFLEIRGMFKRSLAASVVSPGSSSTTSSLSLVSEYTVAIFLSLLRMLISSPFFPRRLAALR